MAHLNIQVQKIALTRKMGKYKIDGNKLYEMYSDEEEWIMNDILLLNFMTLSVQELEAERSYTHRSEVLLSESGIKKLFILKVGSI